MLGLINARKGEGNYRVITANGMREAFPCVLRNVDKCEDLDDISSEAEAEADRDEGNVTKSKAVVVCCVLEGSS